MKATTSKFNSKLFRKSKFLTIRVKIKATIQVSAIWSTLPKLSISEKV